MHEVIFPKIDVGMVSGTFVEWVRKEGENVKAGEVIALGMSEKTTFEIPATATGVLYTTPIEGLEVPIGKTIAVIMEPSDNVEEVQRIVQAAAQSLSGIGKVEAPQEKVAEKIPIEYLQSVPLTGIKKVVAERMTESFHTAPHAVLMIEVDMSEAVKLRQNAIEKAKRQIHYDAIFVKVVAQALREHPLLNSTVVGNEIRVLKEVSVGFAVGTDKGLRVPVVHNPEEKSLAEIAGNIDELAEKAKEDRLSIGDESGGTFTITNLGMFGVDVFIPIINPPQAAILAIGRIADRPQVVDGKVVVKPTLTMSLSFDHRIVDGAPAARFLGRIKQTLESAESPTS